MNTLTHAMQEAAGRMAHRRAVCDAELTLEWATFDKRVGHGAGWLQASGLQRGQRFAVLAL
ncbi:MAG: hypothetical protein Q8M96_01135, partial [Rubrivivax sp.]|nr:hypothetical protein [Rubrivivax sp.]